MPTVVRGFGRLFEVRIGVLSADSLQVAGRNGVPSARERGRSLGTMLEVKLLEVSVWSGSRQSDIARCITSLSTNVQRETTFPQGMSRRQAAPAMPPGAEA